MHGVGSCVGAPGIGIYLETGNEASHTPVRRVAGPGSVYPCSVSGVAAPENTRIAREYI